MSVPGPLATVSYVTSYVTNFAPGPVPPEDPPDDSCRWGDVGCSIGEGLAGAGEKFFGWLVDRTVDGITSMLEVMGTAWFDWPSPTLATRPEVWDEMGLTPTLLKMHEALALPIYFIACISFLVAIIRMVWTMRAQEMQTVLRMFIILLASTVTAAVVVQALLSAGDAFAPWVVQFAAGEEFESTSFQALMTGFDPTGTRPVQLIVIVLLMAVFMILGTIAQVCFMILRAPLILTMMVFLPLVAAGTATEEGMQRFKKVCGFLLAAALYKPVAAVIYATGILLMRTSDDVEGADQVLNLLYGTIVIVLAALALPALIKFFMPSAAVGSSNLFSGGAVGLAGGAAVVGGAMLAGSAGAATGGSAAARGGGMPPPSGPAHNFPALGPGGGGQGGTGGGGRTPPPLPDREPGGGGADRGSRSGGGLAAAGAPADGPSGASNASTGSGDGRGGAPTGAGEGATASSTEDAGAPHGRPEAGDGAHSSPRASTTQSTGSTAGAAAAGASQVGGAHSAGAGVFPTAGRASHANAGGNQGSSAGSSGATTPPALVTREGVVMGAQPGPGQRGGTVGPGRRMGARVLAESGVRAWNGAAQGAGINDEQAEGAPRVPTR